MAHSCFLGSRALGEDLALLSCGGWAGLGLGNTMFDSINKINYKEY